MNLLMWDIVHHIDYPMEVQVVVNEGEDVENYASIPDLINEYEGTQYKLTSWFISSQDNQIFLSLGINK